MSSLICLSQAECLRFVAVLLDAASKGLIIVAAAGAATAILHRSSAAVRHLVWSLALGSLPVLPVLCVALPAWRIPFLPVWAGHVAQAAGMPQGTTRVVAARPVAIPASPGVTDETPVDRIPTVPAMGVPVAEDAAAHAPHRPVRSSGPQWPAAVLILWLVGAGVTGLPLAVGMAAVLHRIRLAAPASPSVAQLLDGFRKQLGIRRTVSLLCSRSCEIPITWGALRPVILVPADIADWPAVRDKIVLLHELAHVRRMDWLTQLAAIVVRILYWFNPLVWLAVRMQRVEAERACDDLVLSAGLKPSEYARQLLDIVTTVRSAGCSSLAAVAMVRKSTLERRILAILNARCRRGALTRLGILAVTAALLGLVVPLSAMRAVAANASPSPATQPVASPAAVVTQPAAVASRQSDVATRPTNPPARRAFLGRILDSAGQPVEGARIELSVVGQDKKLLTLLDGWTGPDGRFRCDEVRADTVFLGVSKEGFRQIGHKDLPVSDREQAVTLLREVVFKGTIVDADTGKPVLGAQVTPGLSWGGTDRGFWMRDETMRVRDGWFEYVPKWQQAYPVTRFLVEADDHLPATSRDFTTEEGEVTCDFRLKRATTTVGRLVASDGHPVARAEVFVGTQSRLISMRGGKSGIPDTVSMLTSEDGRFWVRPQGMPFGVVVIDSRGYAEATQEQIEAGKDVVLQPWARVEGRLMLGEKGQIGEAVLVTHRDVGYARLMYEWTVKTDGQGRFTIDRVPPGRSLVCRSLVVYHEFTGMWPRDHGVLVDMKPGQTASVTVGGQGQPVIGHLVRDGKAFAAAPYFVEAQILLRQANKMPVEFLAMNMQDRTAWLESPEGQAFIASQEKAQGVCYWITVNKDGTFRADDVPEGRYQIRMVVYEANYGPSWGLGKAVARGSLEFAVPQIPGGRSDEPLDLGALELRSDGQPTTQPARPQALEVGQAAPPFEASTLDGKPLRLRDYRGKYVLLDFWATWCGPCVSELPDLKAVYDAFGKDRRFAMVSLSVDEDIQAPTAFARRNQVPWTQGYLGDWKTTKVPDQYGVAGIPAIFLIDPEGKIVAKDLRGPNTLAAVSGVLGGKSSIP